MAFTARAFRTVFGVPDVRSNNEPRSNSPLTGNLLTSFWRANFALGSSLGPSERYRL
jgi:hypothetical protein